MPRPKITKPGTVVYDIDRKEYVLYKAPSVDFPGQAYVRTLYDPETYLTHIRQLTLKEKGEI